MDIYGDHSVCCSKTGDRITRHNRLRNLIFKIADIGLLSPEMEKLGLLGETDRSRRRPGDVSIKNWTLRRGLAIDVAVICPVAPSHLNTPEPCESYALHQKTERYAPAFVHSDYDFAPVVFETSGAVNKEGESVLKQLVRFASKREGFTHCVCSSCLGAFVVLCSILCCATDFEPGLCQSRVWDLVLGPNISPLAPCGHCNCRIFAFHFTE